VIDRRFLAFVAVMAVLIMTPGPDTAMTIRNALRGGRRAATLTALGVGAGSSAWAGAAAVGVAGLLAMSAFAFTVFKLAGGAYLIGLGALTLFRAGRSKASPPPSRGGSPFVQGLVTNLLNPKAAAIFLTVVPQFIQPGDPWPRLVAMVFVFDLMVVGWLVLYGHVIVVARARLGDRLRRGMEAVTGSVLVGLGLRLALERR